MTDLFTPLQAGDLLLPNRILMAPLTRCRAEDGHVPGELMATHYAQRASAGLLIAEATMAMEGNWVINFLLQNYPELNWGVAELPAGPAGKATMAFTVCYGVGQDNPFPEESWELVNFLTGEEGQIRASDVSFGPMPTRPGASEAYLATWGPRSEGLAFDPADIDAFVVGADYSYRWQFPVGFGPFIDTFNSAIQRAASGEITAEDVLFEAELAAMEVMGN